MNLLSKIFKSLKPEGYLEKENAETVSTSATFELIYNTLLIGQLIHSEKKWSFYYSDAFKEQSSLRTITDFPEKDKIYEGTELWPFFASRIPSENQPMVIEAKRKNLIDSFDEVSMLKAFGKRTITNPYILEMA